MKLPRHLSAAPLARPKPFKFYPPKNSRPVTAVVKMVLSRDIRRKLGVTEVSLGDADLETLRALRGGRCLLTPSHSGGYEPHIIMHLSKLLHDDFNYVAAMELFAQSPVQRWVLQRLGVYSIIRGIVDRPSFTMTRQLLSEGKRWLVIFPEGEAVGQNSIVLPFQPGVFQLAFKAYEDAREREAEPSLFVVPIAIRYLYLRDMHTEIDASLNRLESRLGISTDAKNRSRYDRLRSIATALLAANERIHHIASNEQASLNERIQNLKDRVLSTLETQLGIRPSKDTAPLDRVRALFNAVDRFVDQAPPESAYEQQLLAEQRHVARELYHDLWRTLRFVAIYDGYVSESMNVERFMDVLGLLELEVCKRRPVWSPRRACLRVAAPIDLKNYFPQFVENKRQAVKRVAEMVEASVRQMLETLEAECQPLRLSG